MYTGQALWIEAHYQNPFGLRPSEDNVSSSSGSDWTPVWMALVFLPLLTIVSGFRSIAGEKESGTLMLARSTGLGAWQLLAGKALALAGILGVAAVLPVSAALVSVLSIAPSWENIVRLGAVALAVVLYTTVWILLTLAASSWLQSRAALTALLGFWLATTLVAPRMFTEAAARTAPEPQPDEFWAAVKKDGADGHASFESVYERMKTQMLSKFGVSDVKDLPFNLNAMVLQESEELTNAVFDRHYGSLWRTYEQQEAVHRFGSWMSPAQAARFVAMSAAGTDLRAWRRFSQEAEQYRRKLVKALNDDMTVHSKSGDFTYARDADFWRETARFDPTQSSAVEAVTHSVHAWMVLCFWAAGAAAIAALAARRMYA
jgi:ABC-2 type transport system permease protein